MTLREELGRILSNFDTEMRCPIDTTEVCVNRATVAIEILIKEIEKNLPDVPEKYVHIGLINDKGKVKLIIDGEEEFKLNEGESLSKWVRTKKVVGEKL